ncbi:hypothetical protein CLAFUW4_00897 [Fulvia fulva]|uniref:Uncharacterized protein n=1 Tax=Passalora fulva TaxID=5499 RepID=A0A9Q8L8F5_PASFU|nr:uncharacterized protein CLAFUR5_00900 [Fulvia fulva]KAK4635702.1 hypothetical protein CLAFUR4_00898 [Fulvia fulva]KAK4637838.1 hypothetical protein CLAFUR0_00898 [Fulvia fulva]UJO12815.1 hypothetical protein CLAFUR5_00900 [Fulvia fulva]WPV08750.1 hypothetical protein CLAFUW4_00897 [Fulvia fulva]WPV24589.1 hypothetical protein CLAFUW7_00919 [Fulvia fulva]
MADAQMGRLPLYPHRLDMWSDAPTSFDLVEFRRLAQHNRQLLTRHRAEHSRSTPQQVPEPPDATIGGTELTRVLKLRLHKESTAAMPRSVTYAVTLPTEAIREQVYWFLLAREGIDPPRYRARGNTRLHQMSYRELMDMARAHDAPDWVIAGPLPHEDDASALDDRKRSDIVREWLLLQAIDDFESIGTDATDPSLLPDPSLRFDERAQTWNRRLQGQRRDLQQLQSYVRRQFAPDEASGAGHLCGIDALAQAFHATRRLHERLPQRLELDDIMRLRFSNWQPNAYLPDNYIGTRTPEYDNFLQQIYLPHVRGLTPADPVFEAELEVLSTVNNVDVTQLYVTLLFLQHYTQTNDASVSNYVLGMVTDGTRPEDPATAHILGDVDENTRIVWLHNDNAEGSDLSNILQEYGHEPLLGHWSPFVQYGERVEQLDAWGLYRPGSEELRGGVVGTHSRYSRRSAKHRRTAERDKDHRRQMRRLQKCLNCQTTGSSCSLAGTTKSNVKFTDQRCSNCEELGVACEWDESFEVVDRNTTMADLLKNPDLGRYWDIPDPDWATICEDIKNAQATPAMDSRPFALHIHAMRVSSQATPAYLQMLINRLAQFRLRVNNYTNSGANNPEAERPGGANTPLQFFGMVVQRRGVLPWPIAVTNGLADPYLIALVNLLDSWLNPQAAVPTAILITTSGVAGATVPITGFGGYGIGFFSKLQQIDQARGSNLAKNTDLMTLIEHHVHHGWPHSLPQHWQQFFTIERNKYMMRNKLADLITRHTQQMHAADTHTAVPAVFPNALGQDIAARLDAHPELLAEQAAWRYHWLNPAQAFEAMMRNIGRNNSWI